jgi:hypothetical protein
MHFDYVKKQNCHPPFQSTFGISASNQKNFKENKTFSLQCCGSAVVSMRIRIHEGSPTYRKSHQPSRKHPAPKK